jgi:Protein of unknown function (DUF721).
MKRTSTQKLGDVLSDYLQDNPQLSSKLAEVRLMNAWKNTLGNLTRQYTTNLFVRRKILYVKLSSSVLRNELSLCREQLIKKLNEEAGADVIDDIVLS